MCVFFFFQAEDGIRDLVRSRGLGDVYKRQGVGGVVADFRVDAVDEAARTWSWSVRTGPLRLSFEHGVDAAAPASGQVSRAWVVVHGVWPVVLAGAACHARSGGASRPPGCRCTTSPGASRPGARSPRHSEPASMRRPAGPACGWETCVRASRCSSSASRSPRCCGRGAWAAGGFFGAAAGAGGGGADGLDLPPGQPEERAEGLHPMAHQLAEPRGLGLGRDGPLTGDRSGLGQQVVQGAQAAIADANTNDIVPGVRFTLDAHDDQGNPSVGGQAASEVSATKAVGIIGPMNSDVAEQVLPLVGDLAVISPGSTAPGMTHGNDAAAPKRPWPGFFRVTTPDQVQGPILAQFVCAGMGISLPLSSTFQ